MSNELTHLETYDDLLVYQKRVERFLRSEGINCLNIDPEEQDPFFTWSRCECCKRPLGGPRYKTMGFNPHKHQAQGPYEICPDCLHYVEYGQIDDLTLMEIKENERRNK